MDKDSFKIRVVGSVIYGALFTAYFTYSLVIGVGSVLVVFLSFVVSGAIAYFGFLGIGRGVPLVRAAVAVSLVHTAVMMGPPIVSTIGDEGVPFAVIPIALLVGIIVTGGWFLVSNLIANRLARAS